MRVYSTRNVPFGLKNIKATYQRLVIGIFEPLISKTVKIYIDNMMVKSEHLKNHLNDTTEFNVLDRIGMKLNPNKCTFGVKVETFLGYLV